MNTIRDIFLLVDSLFSIDMNIFGFVFSFKSVFIFVCLATIILGGIARFFGTRE